ncbi:hypothetical protein RF11_04311 [Thelohanellus kitauei]|uniref:Uncharacterized protein n=1 Tax=Thelohanellus kitauei TaxID=669202 RepID=A0A0C2M5Q6_THEKT|nr:hypothetical protein RF11_04311 [Thelohanellus kitauei]
MQTTVIVYQQNNDEQEINIWTKACKTWGLIDKRQNKTESSYSCQLGITDIIFKHSKLLCTREFLEHYILEVVYQICPEHRKMFESVCREALNETTDINDIVQKLIFLRGISESLEITEELMSMESMKNTTAGK